MLNGGHVGPRDIVALTFRQDAQVRIYSAVGKRVATVGHRGSGPGEFREPQAQGWIADTLWIYDFGLKRHTFVTADGRLLRTIPLEAILKPLRLIHQDSAATVSNWTPRTRRPDGGMIGIATITLRSRDATPIRELAALTSTADGAATRIANVDADARWEPEFGFPSHFGFSTDGLEMVRVGVTDLQRQGASIVITRLTVRGDTVFSRHMPYRGVPMSRRHVDSVLARGIGPDRVRSASNIRIPIVYAPVMSVYAQPSGLTWLTMRDSESSMSVLMLNRKGVSIARWSMPPRADLMGATLSHVWLRETDADGLQSVVRYRISCNGNECR